MQFRIQHVHKMGIPSYLWLRLCRAVEMSVEQSPQPELYALQQPRVVVGGPEGKLHLVEKTLLLVSMHHLQGRGGGGGWGENKDPGGAVGLWLSSLTAASVMAPSRTWSLGSTAVSCRLEPTIKAKTALACSSCSRAAWENVRSHNALLSLIKVESHPCSPLSLSLYLPNSLLLTGSVNAITAL